METPNSTQILRREVGLGGALLLGLGSILGTGAFVSLGLGARQAGDAMLLALLVAAAVAAANGLASARLAAQIPTSGGTYEFATQLLHPAVGFTAGWVFLCAKGASGAVAALGVAGYVTSALGIVEGPARGLGAVVVVLALTALAAGGLRRSNRVNALMVFLALAGLAAFVAVAGTRTVPDLPSLPVQGPVTNDFLFACALLFVAFTGYGRVATLGEEIRDPARSIPRAVVITVATSLVVYLGVAWAALRAVGAERFGALPGGSAAPLEEIARVVGADALVPVLAVAAVSAMAGVLLNLILGLSRVVLAMARRNDLPAALSRIDEVGSTPTRAVWSVGAAVALVAALGTVDLVWSFSAMTVVIYYTITQLAGWKLARRPLDHVISGVGTAGCLVLAFSIPVIWWGLATAGLALGFTLRTVVRRATA